MAQTSQTHCDARGKGHEQALPQGACPDTMQGLAVCLSEDSEDTGRQVPVHNYMGQQLACPRQTRVYDVPVNSTCQLAWATGCPGICLNIVLGCLRYVQMS